jgi:hypothetical protein
MDVCLHTRATIAADVFAFFCSVLLLFLLREVICWFFKCNTVLDMNRRILKRLEKIDTALGLN